MLFLGFCNLWQFLNLESISAIKNHIMQHIACSKLLAGILFCLIMTPAFAFGEQPISQKTIRIPFRYVQSFIIVEVRLEHLFPLNLIFDTGAEHTIFFDRRWTDVFSEVYQREIKVVGSDLQTEIPALLSKPMNLVFKDQFECTSPLIILEHNQTNISQVVGESVHGILSASLFQNYILQVDYKNRNIVLHPVNAKIPEDYTAIDIQVSKNKPYLLTTIKSNSTAQQKLNLLIDTGASLSLLMYKDSTSGLLLPEQLIPGYLGSGLGGVLSGYAGKIQSVHMDTFAMRDVISHFLVIETDLSKNEKQNKQGLIGNLLLEKFDLFLDYHRQKLYLKPSKNFAKEINFDKSGIMVISGGHQLQSFYVSHVIPTSPAAQAGILPNDQILKVNGWPVAFLSLSKILQIFQKEEGKQIRLTVRRDGKKQKFSFFLRKLL